MLPPELAPSALESAPDAIVVVDASGSVVFANRQLAAVFGYASDEILGRPVEQLLPERFHARHVGHRTGFATGPRVRPMGLGLELAARRKDGSEFPVEISLSPIRDGDRTLIAAAIRDVTDRRRIEAELLAAREAADRANQAKSRFLATASHDLRQPLQALSLLNGTLRRLPADRHVSEALAQQEQAISGMSRLVNALLDISKLESGAIRPEITDFTVATVFEEMRREFASLARNKGLELEVEPCQDAVCSDPSLVEQILRNLVSNAIKYTRQGKVLLRCLHEASVVRLEVLDTGIGIPADELPYIYDEFYQVHGVSGAAPDGYGLGLSIVSRLVQLLDLRLDVRSEPGKGSSFRLDVPASRARVAAGEILSPLGMAADAARPASSPRVLLVEDDAGVRNATSMLLRTEGYEVATAASRAEALQRLGELPRLDLLVTDYHLGGETGREVITAVRERIGPDLRVILISGDTSPLVQALERDTGLRIVSKPIQAERLLALIAELLTG
jgi:two-component system, sensor histidine kinase